jgi:hypothetical protein
MEMTHLVWKWDWAASKGKAFIVDGNGFVVVGPMLTMETARKLVAEHNRLIRQALETANSKQEQNQ